MGYCLVYMHIKKKINMSNNKKKKKIRIEHIGNVLALCNKNIPANLREDLGSDRYKQLGVVERFKGEEEYRICKRCIAKIKNEKPQY